MSELEDKLGAVLSNPHLMQQIMSMAQTLEATGKQAPKESHPSEQAPPSLPNLDPGMLKSLTGFMQRGAVDNNQRALLQALSPYLSRDRVEKLERAMRAAQMAGAASVFLNSGGLQLLTGR